MTRKQRIQKIREEVAADQARYDEVTRRLQERIAWGLERQRQRAERDRKAS